MVVTEKKFKSIGGVMPGELQRPKQGISSPKTVRSACLLGIWVYQLFGGFELSVLGQPGDCRQG